MIGRDRFGFRWSGVDWFLTALLTIVFGFLAWLLFGLLTGQDRLGFCEHGRRARAAIAACVEEFGDNCHVDPRQVQRADTLIARNCAKE